MWLKTMTIKNFRSIENLYINFDRRANVIVGPNAIGKTTLLEAIRLTKATLAPRTANETQQAFISLGALTPHNPNRINFAALAREITQPIVINALFQLEDMEVQSLDAKVEQLAVAVVRSSMGPIASAQGPLALVQHLSSPAGIEELHNATNTIKKELLPIKANSYIELNLHMDATSGMVKGTKQTDQLVFIILESELPASQALFSYFPADRALPVGDVNIQIGGQDIAAQLESHNSQPQTKYHRLKTTIVNNFILGEHTRHQMTADFENVFARVLKDRSLVGIAVNEFGLVSIQIKDTATNRVFDIDGMSSGEKGIILTFLLISQAVHSGGIIALDEPELHLNPAVCKAILPFLIDEYLVPNNVQAIICSHSPELLGVAFDSDACTLLHLQSPTVISKIYPEDRQEVFGALRRLGTSASDALFSAGSIFVEGSDDIDVLQTGFDQLVNKYNLTQLGGRGNVEREIRTLQEAEAKGEVDTLKCFVFDLDNAPSSLVSTKLVKVLQWRRRCLENYLIDDKTIYDILSDKDNSARRINSRGEVVGVFKRLAMSQLQEVVAQNVYSEMHYENLGLRSKEIANKNYAEISDVLFNRIQVVQGQVNELRENEWKGDFVSRCRTEQLVQEAQWEAEWLTLCDGKKFFRDLHQEFGVKASPLKFKKMIVERMHNEKADAWVLVSQLLSEALKAE